MQPKTYQALETEEKWIRIWQEKGLFKPKEEKGKKSFTIVIPPPNITGALHMGHALNNTFQDIFIRYSQMTGKSAYWVPGTDHGGIATQNVMEKALKAEGKTKEDLGREAFLERMWAWYGECGNTILNQLKKLGCSIDFSKENIRFTMDEERAKAVFESFRQLWEKGLIYRGERIINWCPRCYTALSDIEVEYEEEKSFLWHIKYPLAGESGHITVATTRPETMLGDTAVAVNPKDKRYSKIIGKKLKLPLTQREIPIIADEEVDMTFGTGAVKVTPFHDPADFEISLRHSLPSIQVISYEGKMENCPEKYLGKKAAAARKEIVEDLKDSGFLEKEEPYKHNVGKCYRCSNHIEPLVSEQWFVKTKPLAEKAIEKTEKGEFSLYPENWKNPFLLWLKNIKDWCISRQIWWGHRIPAWYCKNCAKEHLFFDEKGSLKRVSLKNKIKPVISDKKPQKCEICESAEMLQDPDVLDTWFSSALWPMSVFGWPKKTAQLEYFYPTSLLITGYEILYLWVARMVMSGLFHS
ncbi:MAG: valine--tRNA ligase, partial [Elusimicrobia bacterium]|nr:valine--tRNA ligase [Elusimicrobiota bacterium]